MTGAAPLRAVHLQVALLDTGPVLACNALLEPETRLTKARGEVTCPFCRAWKRHPEVQAKSAPQQAEPAK